MKDDTDLSTIDFAGAMAKAGGKDLQVLLMGSAGKQRSGIHRIVKCDCIRSYYFFRNSKTHGPKDKDRLFGGFAARGSCQSQGAKRFG